MASAADIPVTVIGGYLGAGKTSLLNALLRADTGVRVAVLVNDFGAINIDSSLIRHQDGDTISLTNGCVCCTIADDLGDTLSAINGWPQPPDQVVVEASGVADPGKIAIYGQGWPGFRLAGVITLADASSVRGQAGDKFVGELIRRQLRHADVIALTRADLLSEAGLSDVRRWIGSQIGPHPVIDAPFGQAGCDAWLLGQHRGQVLTDLPGALAPQADDLFVSASVDCDQMLSTSGLESALRDLAPGLIRLKGFAWLDQAPQTRFIVQAVGQRWQILADDDWPPGGAATRLVAIGLRGQIDVQEALRELIIRSGALYLSPSTSSAAASDRSE